MTDRTVHGHASALFDLHRHLLPPPSLPVIDTTSREVRDAIPAATAPVVTTQSASDTPDAEPSAEETLIVAPRGFTELARRAFRPAPRIHARAQRAAVSAYRVIGFALLTMIVAALLGYITQTLFYMVSTRWATPIALGPSDEKVVEAVANLTARRDERARSSAELAETDRAIAAHREYQAQLVRSIEKDLAARRSSLEHARGLAREASAARARIASTASAYATDHDGRVGRQYDAGLIDDSSLLAAKFQLAQISSSTLAMAQKQGELEQQAAALSRQTAALDALLGDAPTESALPYDVLSIKRELDASKRELANAMDRKVVLESELARQDALLQRLEQSPYLRAATRPVTVALVPYDNLSHARAGAEVTACRIAMLVCRRIGVVGVVLPGEVSVRHPHRDQQVRGQMVELVLDVPAEATSAVVFLDGAPLLF